MTRTRNFKRRNRPFWDNKKHQAQQKDPDTWSTDTMYQFWCKKCRRLCGWGFEVKKSLIEEWEADGELCADCQEERDNPKVVDPQHRDNMEDALFNG